jgi:hypothetical protein
MITEAHVAALRGMLVDFDLVKNRPERRWETCFILSEAEWLVSLLSHSQSLCLVAERRENLFKVPEALRELRREWTIEEYDEVIREDVVNFVDIIRFMWLNHGVKFTLDFVKGVDFSVWCQMALDARANYLNGLVVIAERKLSIAGVKHRDRANFFSL